MWLISRPATPGVTICVICMTCIIRALAAISPFFGTIVRMVIVWAGMKKAEIALSTVITP